MQRFEDWDGLWIRGCKSDADPGTLARGYYWMAVNMLNEGGVLTARPGHRCIVKLPPGNLQGAALFRPKVGLEEMVVVIEGHVYVSPWPFEVWTLLDAIQFVPHAKQIYFELAEQSAERITQDLDSAIQIIEPKSVLMMQDGGFSPCGWYNGSDNGQLRDYPYQTPAGGPMKWIGDRLWVGVGNSVYASDISNPFSFRELIYLGGVGAFTFPTEVTALAATPGLETKQLMVFTEHDCSILLANVRARDTWPQIENMQQQVFAVGCPSQRSVVEHFGNISWLSQQGFTTFDAATQAKLKMRIPIRDSELRVSKIDLHEDMSLCAAGAFQKYIAMSVPYADLYNKHTWVLNNASFESMVDDSGPSWAGIWLGTRPVQWVYGVVAGTERIYHVSADEDGQNRLWESFLPQRLDNGCPFPWYVMTRGFFGLTSETKKPLGADCKFCYADVALTGVEEDLNLAIYYAGGMRGAFKRVANRLFKVERGNLQSGREYTATTGVFAYKPQSRRARTEDARGLEDEEETGSCPIERDKTEEIDESFQLLVAGYGPATIRWIRTLVTEEAEDYDGAADACEDETGVKVLRFDGAGATGETVEETDAALESEPIYFFESNQTETVTDGEFSSVGVGHAQTIISQACADRAARIYAQKQADRDVQGQKPPVLSQGKGFDETV